MPDRADTSLISALSRARSVILDAAVSAEQRRLIGPAVAEIDRVIASVRPAASATFQLTPVEETAPPDELEVEALRREVERLRVLARQDRGLLDVILNHSPHGMLVSDADGKIILQNRASERVWAGSATADTVEQWGQYRAFHPDGRPYASSDWAMNRCLSSRAVITAEEVHFQRFDGTHGMLLGSCAPIVSGDGELVGALSIFADITEFKQLEAKLRVSEAWLATTLKSIGDAVIATNSAGRIEFMNPMAEALTGWSISEARGLPLGDVYRTLDERTREELDSPVTKVLRSGTLVGLAESTQLVRKNGTELAVDERGAPIRNDEGELIGVVLVFRDVTEKRREDQRRQFISEASRKLALSGLDFEATLGNVACLAAPHVADGAIVDILESDGSVVRLSAIHLESAQGDVIDALRRRYPSEPDVPYAVHGVLRTGESILWPDIQDSDSGTWTELGPGERRVELSAAVRPDDRDLNYLALLRELGVRSAMIVPLRARGRTRGAITLVSAQPGRRYNLDDLTLAEELSSFAALALDNAQLYREAQQVNRAKDEFLATLSHELRTPLTAILGWTRMLRQGSLKPETQARALEAIERNGALQAQLVEDLLDASRIITGKLRLEVTALDLPPVVHAAIDAVRHGADAKGIEISVSLDPSAGPISGDPTRLQQVVWNLLSNAIKFTPKGGRVSVQLVRIGGAARLEVRDNGQGIAQEFLPYVFDRFRQADSTSTRPHSGLGLGLAIARHLVELHGGVVRAESAGEGRGAIFTVEMPIAVGASALRKLDNAAALLDSEPTLQGLHILVVDDEPDARELVGAVLERKGATVTTAATVTDALATIERIKPDVILSDLGMPGEDGYSLIRRLRARSPERGGRIPAAALTAYASAQDRTRALLAGFQSHVPKPIEASELAAVIANLAGRTG
ncbi:hybrid sensor histidine kinase/response regulator [Chondromyces crocatus]|uniref:histidine kinase n=1 Tax=Chondromyces crocatus TaxID=52 RepID=A0A0K1EB38_CHOCO|nr:hybrid sensor histidine kinase/response regulator [Chondromyces crocatus]AKT38070.1 two-component hybrid sensor and regulator [Chondromyces crocatus]